MPPTRGVRRWHDSLLQHDEVATWYNNQARRNQTTADESLRKLGRTLHDALGTTPVDLLRLDQARLEDAVGKCIEHQ